jgi:hypothetical protein
MYFKQGLGIVALVVALLAPSAASAVNVNCNAGRTIAAALARGQRDITVIGTCTENLIEIRLDDVRIVGQPNARIIGEVFINGARRVSIANLTVQGGTPGPNGIAGISVFDGGHVLVTNVVIENVPGPGVYLERASAVLDAVTVQGSEDGVLAYMGSALNIRNGSQIQSNTAIGVHLDLGAAGNVDDSTMQNNGDTGVSLFRGATIDLSNSLISGNIGGGVVVAENSTARLNGNSITAGDTAGALVLLRGGSARLRGGGNTLTNQFPGGFAVELGWGTNFFQDRGHDVINGAISFFSFSTGEFRDVEINGNIEVGDHSTMRFREATVTGTPANTVVNGNIELDRDSGLTFSLADGPVNINGNIHCFDAESSFGGTPAQVIVSGTNDCDGFD